MGVWLDSEKAFFISLTDEGESIYKISSDVESRVRFPGEKKPYHRFGRLNVSPQKKTKERKKHQLADYFVKVMDNLRDADEIFLFGPSITKEWLEKEIKKHADISKKLIGIENADLITEKQMIARAKEFFHEHEKDKKKKK